LAPTLKRYEGVWFGWSGNVVPRDQVTTKTIEKSKQSYVLTDLAEEDYQEYYGGFANRVLWPILHYRIDLAEFTRRDLTGYLRVNRHFADELSKVILPSDLIWVHDYHFYPARGGTSKTSSPQSHWVFSTRSVPRTRVHNRPASP
jgi:trehalose 6-phosphate synthase